MRVAVTGAAGKVGRGAVAALVRAGHEVIAIDLGRPEYERSIPGEAHVVRADVTDAGEAFAALGGAEAVVHAAAIPDPFHDPPHVVFRTNVLATFNVVEGALAAGAGRIVNVSSETVVGFLTAVRPALPAYVPVDEEHPTRPQEAYATSKLLGEGIVDAAVRRSDVRAVSVRPTWVQWEGNYERSLGPIVRDPAQCGPNLGSYVDADDLGELIRLAVESDLPGHEVLCAAAADNAAGRPLAELAHTVFGHDVPVRHELLEREDGSGVSSAKARRLLGWRPERSWREFLDENGTAR